MEASAAPCHQPALPDAVTPRKRRGARAATKAGGDLGRAPCPHQSRRTCVEEAPGNAATVSSLFKMTPVSRAVVKEASGWVGFSFVQRSREGSVRGPSARTPPQEPVREGRPPWKPLTSRSSLLSFLVRCLIFVFTL